MPKVKNKGAKEDIVSDGSGESSKPLTENEKKDIGKFYNDNLVRNQALIEEVVFILKEKIAAAEIKIRGIEQRLKSLESVLDKCERKSLQNLDHLVDVVGARVVCLFRSDMSRVGRVIEENFEVVGVDDKLAGEVDSLGYMSVHYICKIPSRYSGPRYEQTANIALEIQIRTLCMHAWAAVSHYLDYKGDWDVPVDLKRALSALSGLFYVADSEFEQFYAARVHSKREADVKSVPAQDQEVNLDTMTSYLEQKYPDRILSDPTSISDLVKQVKSAGYTSILQLDHDVERGKEAFLEYEKMHPPGSGRFYAVGAVRVTLEIVSGSNAQDHQDCFDI